MISEESYNELIKYKNGSVKTNGDLTDRQKYLLENNLIEECDFSSDVYPGYVGVFATAHKITILGEDCINEFERNREQHSKQERQQRFDNKISVASVLVPLITFIVGILVEYLSGIAGWFASLFQ